MRHFERSRPARLIAGWLLVGTGTLLAPTPLPVGIVLLLVGLCLLARDSKAVRGLIRRLRRRCPAASARADAWKHRLPELVRRIIERTDPRRRPRFRRRGSDGSS